MSTSVSLGNHYDDYVQRKIESGQYASVSEVLRAALRLLEEQDEMRQVRLAKVNALLDEAEGRPAKLASDVLPPIKAQLEARAAAKKGAKPARRGVKSGRGLAQ
jgi:antitoxin ParD1/3/4